MFASLFLRHLIDKRLSLAERLQRRLLLLRRLVVPARQEAADQAHKDHDNGGYVGGAHGCPGGEGPVVHGGKHHDGSQVAGELEKGKDGGEDNAKAEDAARTTDGPGERYQGGNTKGEGSEKQADGGPFR